MFTVHTELNLAHQFKKIIEADGLLCIPCACIFNYLCNVKIMALILSLYVLGLNLLDEPVKVNHMRRRKVSIAN